MTDFDNDPTVVGSPTDAFPREGRGLPLEADSRLDDDDETMVNFPPMAVPPELRTPELRTPREGLPGIRPPRTGFGPARALNDELFGDVEDQPIPPPLLVTPRPRVVRARLGSSAQREASAPGTSLLALAVAFSAGTMVASVVFLVAGHLRGGSRPTVATARPGPSPRPSPRKVASVAPQKTPRPAPAPELELDLARPGPASPLPDDPPVVAAGKQLARALAPCKLQHGGQSLRLGAYLQPAGRVRRVYMARRGWLGAAGQRCVRRQLVGLSLGGFRARGYVEWHLWLDPDAVDAARVRHRRR